MRDAVEIREAVIEMGRTVRAEVAAELGEDVAAEQWRAWWRAWEARVAELEAAGLNPHMARARAIQDLARAPGVDGCDDGPLRSHPNGAIG